MTQASKHLRTRRSLRRLLGLGMVDRERFRSLVISTRILANANPTIDVGW